MARRGRRSRTRQTRTVAAMERVLDRKDREGLTYGQLSEKSGIPVSTLQWWRSKLRERSELARRRPAKTLHFVEACLPPVTASRYEIVLGNGRRLRIDGPVEQESVRALLEVLDEAC